MNPSVLSTPTLEQVDILILYPNPFKDVITFNNLTNIFKNGKVTVYSISGKVAYQNILKSKSINLGFLANRVYILTLEGKNSKVITKKIIKQ